ncbi:MAG: EAL domain-containing protein [Pontibacterium sp.]
MTTSTGTLKPGLSNSSDLQQEVSLSAAELDQLLQLQQVIFSKVANNDHHQGTLEKLCSMAESFLPNSVATIMQRNSKTGLIDVLCAPSVPQAGVDALQGLKPGLGGGSCGNAIFCNVPVFVQDTFKDPRWLDLRQTAYDFNLRACWSMPVRNEVSEAIGSFALSSFEHRSPSDFHRRLLDVAASMVSIVLARRAQDQLVEESNKRLTLMGTALSQSTEGVLITDANNTIVETNRAFETITGYVSAEVKGKNPRIFSSGRQDKAFYQAMWGRLSSEGNWKGEIVNLRKDGSELTQWMSLSAIKDAAGQVQNYVAVFADLTELKEGKEQLVYALEHDQLTGLPNKSMLSLLLDSQDELQSLLLLNVDNFSYINTAYGLAFGDQLLCAVAQVLCKVSGKAQVFRINADEFALYFESEIDLQAVIEAVRQQFFNHPVKVDDLGFYITFTFGGVNSSEGVFGKAIQALRKARTAGKNHSHIYSRTGDEPDQTKRIESIRWNGLLHDALNEGRVKPYFQGIRDNFKGEIVRYEALVRLEHEGQIYSPSRFLNAARLSGLLPVISRLMIEQGFAEIAGKGCALSINITEEDLNQNYLEACLEQKTRAYGIHPSQVVLEILEGVSSTGKKNHIKQLRALKSKGYQLAIDDFGTEYSNFERILELNVDYLKIDSKYIKNIAEDKTSYEVARAIVYFAKNAGIATVAEYVHNKAVQQVVEALGIEYSQGYLFSEPAPVI